MYSIDEIIKAASCSRLPDPKIDLRASALYLLDNDPFGLWCSFYAPRQEAVNEHTRYDKAKSDFIKKLRETWIKSRYPDALDLAGMHGIDGLKAAVEAMASGKPALRHAHLWDLENNAYGTADLLVKDGSAASVFGNYHYKVVEFKYAGEIKSHHNLQGALYNRMLGRIQSYTPEKFTIVLRDYLQTDVPSRQAETALDAKIACWKKIRDNEFVPDPARPPKASNPPWRIFANKFAFETGNLALIAGLGPDMRAKLKSSGIINISGITSAGLDAMREMLGDSPGGDAYYNALAYCAGKPVPKPSAAYAPERGKRNLYFDFETSDDIHPKEPPHTYLIGLYDLEEKKYVKFLAKGAKQEEKIFRDFVDYIGHFSKARLFHWTAYEINQMKETAKKYPVLEGPFNELFQSCVDLKECVKRAFYLPAPSFSLKSAAPALGFSWRQKDVGAMESMTYYWDWLAGDSKAIEKVLAYNEDDCVAMVHIDRALSPKEEDPKTPKQGTFDF